MAGSAGLARTLAVVVLALAAAGLLMQTPLLQSLSRRTGDLQGQLLAPKANFDGALIIDIDEMSMAALEPELGTYPYDREPYALVTEWLERMGARSISFDIVFSDRRRGDAEFARALVPLENVALATAQIGQADVRSSAWFQQLTALAWAVPAGTPAYRWADMALPRDEFARGPKGPRVGVIGTEPDEDGVLRRVPLLHRIRERILPSLPLATLALDSPGAPLVRYDAAAGRLQVGERSWPVGEDSSVLLEYPANATAVRKLAFRDVFHAALGDEDYANLGAQVRGRRIFLGSSTAILGDYIQTPDGRIPGLLAVVLAEQLLEQNLVLQPASPWLDWGLVLIALVIPLAAFQERLQGRPIYNLLALLAMGATVTGLSTLLFLQHRSSHLVFPLLAGLCAFLALVLLRLLLLYQEKQRLTFERAAAEEAYRLKSQFISQMTHELRTPLTAIMGFNRLLGEGALPDPTREQYVKVVDRNSQHLITLINNMLDQSKIEAGQMKISPGPADVREVVEEVVVTLSTLAADKMLTLTHELDAQLPRWVELDAFRLRQILINLVGNAIKFTARGTVQIHGVWLDERLCLRVTDSGPGMSAATLQRIFEPFRQGSDETQKSHGGTGLGLTISRNLVAMMGGELTVESHLGIGSTFRVSLPAALAQPRESGSGRAPAGATAAMLSGRVLLADDNSDIRDLVARYLRRMGLTVLIAEDGAQAVSIALQELPDVILIDMEMPVLSGFDAVRQLRSRGYRRPILTLTAHPEGPEIQRALAEGCDGYVAKPVDRARLQTVLAGLLPAHDAGPVISLEPRQGAGVG